LQILTFLVLYQLSTPLLTTGSSFEHLINTPNILVANKTVYIEPLDGDAQYQILFLRPRRSGKTTFLQMLASYYDLNKAHEFDNTFSQLYIGKNPRKDRVSLLVLLFEFSGISAVDYAEAEK
jgi:Predicted AAA-ATPase